MEWQRGASEWGAPRSTERADPMSLRNARTGFDGPSASPPRGVTPEPRRSVDLSASDAGRRCELHDPARETALWIRNATALARLAVVLADSNFHDDPLPSRITIGGERTEADPRGGLALMALASVPTARGPHERVVGRKRAIWRLRPQPRHAPEFRPLPANQTGANRVSLRACAPRP